MHENILQFLKDVAYRHQSKSAVEIERSGKLVSYSYETMIAQAEILAERLREAGAKAGDHIALVVDNSPATVAAFLAPFAIGCISVLIDPNLSTEEIKQLIEQSGAKAIVLSPNRLDKSNQLLLTEQPLFLCEFDFPYIEQSTQKMTTHQADKNLSAEQDVAAIFHTSGTSGSFKGVELTHTGLIAGMLMYEEELQINADDRYLQVLPLFHIYPMIATLSALGSGGTIRFIEKLEGSVIFENIQTLQPTFLFFVPRLLDLIALKIKQEIDKKSAFSQRLIRSIQRFLLTLPVGPRMALGRIVFRKIHTLIGLKNRYITSGGAALSAETHSFLTSFGLRIIEGYGLTETAGIALVESPEIQKPGSVGKPPKGVEAKLNKLNSQGEGELWIKTPTIMKGYLNEPTSEFLKNDGWFNTCDIAKVDEEGFYYICGRKQDIIVLSSGKKVMPERIEKPLKQIREIEEVAIFGLPKDSSQSEEVAAAIVHRQDSQKSGREIKEQIIKQIQLINSSQPPAYHVHNFYFLDALPKTTTMKVIRARLASLIKKKHTETPSKKLFLPSNAVEENIVAIWREELGCDIYEEDNFFLIGGDSLTLTNILSSISKEYNLHAFEQLFDQFIQDPTVSNMSQMIQNQLKEEKKQKSRSTQKKVEHPTASTLQQWVGTLYQFSVVLALPSLIALFLYAGIEISSLITPSIPYVVLIPTLYSSFFLLLSAIIVGSKWLLIGRYQEGHYPLYGSYFYRHWTVQHLFDFLKIAFWPLLTCLENTRFTTILYRLLGAKIAPRGHIEGFAAMPFDQIRVGNDSVVKGGVIWEADHLTASQLIIEPITIGERCTVETEARLRGNCVVENDSRIEIYESQPKKSKPLSAHSNDPSTFFHISELVASFLLIPLFFSALVSIGVAVGSFITSFFGEISLALLLLLHLATLVITTPLLVSLTKKLIIPSRLTYQQFGWVHFMRKQGNKILKITDILLTPIGGTLIYNLWLRLCGLHVGKNCIINPGTNLIEHVDYLTLEERVFIGHSAFSSSTTNQEGIITHYPSYLEDDSMVNLESHIGAGIHLEKGSSVSPSVYLPNHTTVLSGCMYNGTKSTPITFGVKQHPISSKLFPALSIVRMITLFLTLSSTLFVLSFFWSLHTLHPILYFFFGYWTIKGVSFAQLFTAKWILKGKIKPYKRPLSDPSVWLEQAILSPLTWVVHQYIFAEWRGTKMMNLLTFLLGGRIQSTALINTAMINDWDMVKVETGAVINDQVRLIGHLLVGGVQGLFVKDRIHIASYAICNKGISVAPPANIAKDTEVLSTQKFINHFI